MKESSLVNARPLRSSSIEETSSSYLSSFTLTTSEFLTLNLDVPKSMNLEPVLDVSPNCSIAQITMFFNLLEVACLDFL